MRGYICALTSLKYPHGLQFTPFSICILHTRSGRGLRRKSQLSEIAIDASATEFQDEGFKRSALVRGLNAELRNMIQGSQRQLEQQRHC